MGWPKKIGDEPQWRVRVLDPQGLVLGTGFLIGDRLLLTCAHVVGRPTGNVRVELPAFGQERSAEVLPGGWFPAEPDGGDLAVLSLIGPPVRCDPLPVLRPDEEAPPDAEVRYYGYPSDADQGTWISASLSGRRLEGDFRPGPGFSGAAVLSRETGHVVGMVTAASSAPVRTVVMLPVEAMVKLWPPLTGLATSPHVRGTLRPTVADAGTIVDALLKMPEFAERRLRALYADLFADRLGARPAIGDGDDARRELWSLVTWCVERPSAFYTLLDVVRAFHPASVEVEQLAERIEHLVPRPLLTEAERRDLLRLVEGSRVPAAEVLRSASFSSPLNAGRGDLPATLQALEDAIGPPGEVPPLLDFVAGLAEREGSATRAELWAWIDRVAERFELPRSWAAERGRPEEPPAQEAPSYLTVQLEEDGLDADHFLLTVSSQQPDRPATVLLSPDEPMTLAEVQRAIEETVRSVRSPAPRNPDDLVIEFVLPRALLGAPVDEWRVADAARPDDDPIGAVYPVVVRSLDRARAPWPHLERQRRWEAEHRGAHALYLADEGREEALDAVRAGVPVVLWHRGAPAPEAVAEVRSLLAGTPVEDLPRVVRDLRKAAAAAPGDPTHPGRGIHLVFDDPGRLRERAGGFHVPEGPEETSR